MTAPALAFNKRGAGRHYRHPTTGVEVPSITNVIGILDRPAIPRWAAKLVAEQAWLLRDSLTDLGKDEAIDILKGSPWRKSTRAADRGTSVHDYLEAAANGKPLPELDGDALRYKAAADTFLHVYKPVFHHTEFTVFSSLGYAGTGDAIATINGRKLVIDYKTSKTLYAEIALQLAALARAEVIVTPEGAEIPMPAVDGCAGVLLTPDGCDVREVDTTGAFEAFLGCLQAWHWKTGEVSMTPLLWRSA